MKRKLMPRGGERRQTESGPPKNWKERRVSVEKRMPEVKEISLEEWKQAMKQSSYTSADGEDWSIAVSKTLRK